MAEKLVEITLLGDQRVTVDGVLVDALRSTRALGLLAYLVLHAGSPQPRALVAGLFWPDSTEAQARTNLRRELHQLRAALPDADRCVIADGKTIGWNTDCPWPVDLTTLQQAAAEAEQASEDGDDETFVAAAGRAVDRLRGELLPGFYDDWVVSERDRLQRRVVSLLDQVVLFFGERGDIDTALPYARRRVELEPLEESGYQTLIRLEVSAGEKAAALRTYHRCASRLERELGVGPSPETMAVYEELVAPTASADKTAPLLKEAAPLTGRDTQLAELRGHWAKVVVGPRLVVVVGEAGMGKTRLAAEFAAESERDGATVAWARCYASRRRLALAPVTDWLRTPDLLRAQETLEPVWRTEVARLIPELGMELPQSRSDPLSDGWQRRQFFEGLARTVYSAEPPTVLVLDDLQWCDAETLAWLEVLVHLDPRAPLLVVATLRIEELADQPALAGWYQRLRQGGVLEQIDLPPLSVGDTAELARALTGTALDQVEARELARMTGGFPLFVIESLRRGSASSRIEAVLASRLDQLGPAAEELAGLAAAVGRDFSLDLLATAGAVNEELLVTAVDELWRRRLLRETSRATYDFTHDLLRVAAYERLTPPHRRILHRRIAAALEQMHADRLDIVAAQIADQHERGGQFGEAVRFHQRAADAAREVFAHDDAVFHAERALAFLEDLPPGVDRDRLEVDVLEAMGSPLVALSGYGNPRLGQTLERLTRLGQRLGDETVVVRSEAARFSFLFVQGRIDEASELAEQLAGRADQSPEQRGELWVTRGFGLMSQGRLVQAMRQFAEIEEGVDAGKESPLGFPIKVMARGWQAKTLWLAGRSEEAATRAESALTLAAQLEHPFGQAVAQGYAAITNYLRGDAERTTELASSVQDLCRRYDFAYYGEWGRILEGAVTGGSSGEKMIRDGLRGLDRLHAGRARPFWLSLLAGVLDGRGSSDEAEKVLTDARVWAERTGDRWWLAELWRLSSSLDEAGTGESMLGRALHVAEQQGAWALALRAATDLARRQVEAGSTEKAADLLLPIRDRASDANPADVAAADEVLGQVAADER